ncbi:MAG: shikimate kinase [Gammaproteobacteria bacterium]|jgi:shikimate kinase|nr:shikimate kinase [Gammaproteobacteria bacterium]
MTCISLIGMPAAGKSTIGVLLAKALGYDFLDTDLLIQVTTQRTLPQIIAEDGFLELRKIEADVIGSVNCDRTVIATGGSAVYALESMAHLRSLGQIVYLRADADILQERIGNLESRGVAAAANATLESIIAERLPMYERLGDLTVDAGQNPEIVLANLLQALSVNTDPN